MTAVNIKGTFTRDERTDNGLESISENLVKDELARHVVVGVVELHKVTKRPGEPPVPTIRFVAVEPLDGDAQEQGRQMLDQARKLRGLGHVADTLPFDDGPDDGPVEGHDDEGPVTDRPRDAWLDENGDKS
jgi:hypothetical protein